MGSLCYIPLGAIWRVGYIILWSLSPLVITQRFSYILLFVMYNKKFLYYPQFLSCLSYFQGFKIF